MKTESIKVKVFATVPQKLLFLFNSRETRELMAHLTGNGYYNVAINSCNKKEDVSALITSFLRTFCALFEILLYIVRHKEKFKKENSAPHTCKEKTTMVFA